MAKQTTKERMVEALEQRAPPRCDPLTRQGLAIAWLCEELDRMQAKVETLEKGGRIWQSAQVSR